MPSPTFLLHNAYPVRLAAYIAASGKQEHQASTIDQQTISQQATEEDLDVHHMDLFRLTSDDATLQRLNVDQTCATGVCLIEWAQRLPSAPQPAIHVFFTLLTQVRCSVNHSSQDVRTTHAWHRLKTSHCSTFGRLRGVNKYSRDRVA